MTDKAREIEHGGAAVESPPLTRRERRKREVHDRILGAALELFENQGLEKTRIDDICELADVAQKTFFNHFPTRQHLVAEIADVLFVQLRQVVDESRTVRGGVAERLVYFFDRLAVETEQTGPMHREVIREVIRSANLTRSQAEHTRKLVESLRVLIEGGLEAGKVTPEYSVELLTQMVLNSFFGIMLSWISVDDYPLRKHAAEAARFLGKAIEG